MKKAWSISTTVRNPDRLRDFLRVLKELKGQQFNSENQIKYQSLLIQNRLYRPTYLTKEQNDYFENIEKEMPLSIAKAIFNAQNYEDPAMRGRNSVAPLNKMGLCVAKNSAESVKITPIGEYFLSESYDLGKLFLIHFLKWQLPNPESRTFSKDDGFNIKPFVGTLHLIDEVNKKWIKMGNEPIGISKDELSLFAPTLIDYRDIDNQAERLIEYRVGIRSQKDDSSVKQFRDKFSNHFAEIFLKNKDNIYIRKLLNNLKDYGDNTIRYFRLTRFIYIRGGGFYVDLEPRRAIETKKLLLTDNASPLLFKSSDDYIEYLADIEQPTLPWESKLELETIVKTLNQDIEHYVEDLQSTTIEIPIFKFQEIKSLSSQQLKEYIEKLRDYRRKLQELETNLESKDITKIQQYINAFKTIHQSKNKKSIELEKLATLALNSLNDAIEIMPNYPVGDDNEPTFTAPSNKPDIECFYEKFNSICEVTMLTDRTQWFNEGQPVMRHVRDFENSYPNKLTYCLFIAPRLHQDTIETFWMAIRYGYKGAPQRIVPFSITQFIKLLDVLLETRSQKIKFTHDSLLLLYEQIVDITNQVANSEEWILKIPEIINIWQTLVLSN
ncbi:restriction endonuclease AlwI [Candidatus Magnetoovum chiemensis]|nr:restriction endonuclease AlwI [Candidatus Magnetoovum chiemensis]